MTNQGKKIGTLVMMCSIGMSAQATIIDDFSGDLSAYTKTIVLAQNGDGPLDFSITSGALQVGRTFGGGSGAQQDLFLRNDFSLGVGEILRIDTSFSASDGAVSDFGLAISALVNPPGAVWTSGTADTRQDFINVYAKRQTGSIGYNGYNGTAQIGSSSGINPGVALNNVIGLFISRSSSTNFDVGFTTASGDTVIKSFFEPNTAVGTAIGIYADVRSTTTYGTVDNLRIELIPEPTTVALVGLGAFGCVFYRRCWK